VPLTSGGPRNLGRPSTRRWAPGPWCDRLGGDIVASMTPTSAAALVRRLREERGQTSAEYVGMLVLVAAIVLAVSSAGIGDRLTDTLRQQIAALTSDQPRNGGGGGAGDQGAGSGARPTGGGEAVNGGNGPSEAARPAGSPPATTLSEPPSAPPTPATCACQRASRATASGTSSDARLKSRLAGSSKCLRGPKPRRTPLWDAGRRPRAICDRPGAVRSGSRPRLLMLDGSLIGRRLAIDVSEPWELAREQGDPPLVADVRQFQTSSPGDGQGSLLLELRGALDFRGVGYKLLVARLRDKSAQSHPLPAGARFEADLYGIPLSKEVKDPFDLSWWRGGLGMVASLQID